MKNVGSLSLEELDLIIEQKILEIFGDPDTNLELREEFIEKLKSRLSDKRPRVPHREAVKKFG